MRSMSPRWKNVLWATVLVLGCGIWMRLCAAAETEGTTFQARIDAPDQACFERTMRATFPSAHMDPRGHFVVDEPACLSKPAGRWRTTFDLGSERNGAPMIVAKVQPEMPPCSTPTDEIAHRAFTAYASACTNHAPLVVECSHLEFGRGDQSCGTTTITTE